MRVLCCAIHQAIHIGHAIHQAIHHACLALRQLSYDFVSCDESVIYFEFETQK